LSAPDAAPWSRRRTLAWGAAACAVVLAVHLPALLFPALLIDDFQILSQSWTWHDAWANLWVPNNEHSMPLGRLSTCLLAHLAGRQTNLPLTFALQGPLAVLAGMLFLYLLVRRETGHPLPGLVAMTLFGVTPQYQHAVHWYAASFALLALDTTLLGLLAAQRWRQTSRPLHLVLAALWAGLAPGWFGSGMLAGPLIALYLVGPRDDSPIRPWTAGWRRWLAALAPILGTAVSLAITAPHNASRILNLPRVEVQATAWQTFNPLVGLAYTFRIVVDDLLPGAVGISGQNIPIPWVIAAWIALGAAGAWWWWRAPHRRLLLLGLGFLFSNYWLIFSARAYFTYEEMHQASRWVLFTRYHVFAQVGLALFVCGGWPVRQTVPVTETAADPRVERALGVGAAVFLAFVLTSLGLAALGLDQVARSAVPLQEMPQLTRFDQVARVGLILLVGTVWLVARLRPGDVRKTWLAHALAAEFVLLMVLSQGPRWRGSAEMDFCREQQADLRRVEAVDALCRAHHISAETARQELSPFDVTGCNRSEVQGHVLSGWDFLRGSSEPRATAEEARQVLEAEQQH
jgi:hypothetical protein